MPLEKPRPRSARRSSVEAEEARAWVSFYRRVGGDPAVAAEVIAQLESDAKPKRLHLARTLTRQSS